MTKKQMEISGGMIGASNRGLHHGKEENTKEAEKRVKLMRGIKKALEIGKKKGANQ